MFSQDKVFARSVVGLPHVLKEALQAAELLDPGLLKACPRSDWAVLATAERKDELKRGTRAATAPTSSPTASSRPISSTVSPSLPGTGLGLVSVGDPVVVLGTTDVCGVSSAVISRVSSSISVSGVSADTSARFAPQVPGAVTTAFSTCPPSSRTTAATDKRVSSAPSHPVVTSGSQPVSHANASSSMFGDQHTTESETVVGTSLLPQASVACLAVERSMEVMRPVRADGCVSEGIETSHLHCENPGSSVRVDGLGSIDVECPVSGDGFLTDPEFPHALTPTPAPPNPHSHITMTRIPQLIRPNTARHSLLLHLGVPLRVAHPLLTLRHRVQCTVHQPLSTLSHLLRTGSALCTSVRARARKWPAP